MQHRKAISRRLVTFALIVLAGTSQVYGGQDDADAPAPVKRLTLRRRDTGNLFYRTGWQDAYVGRVVKTVDSKLLFRATSQETRTFSSPFLNRTPYLSRLVKNTGVSVREMEPEEIWIDFQDIYSIQDPE